MTNGHYHWPDKNTIEVYNEHLYVKNLEEINTFLEKYLLPRLNKKEIEPMN